MHDMDQELRRQVHRYKKHKGTILAYRQRVSELSWPAQTVLCMIEKGLPSKQIIDMLARKSGGGGSPLLTSDEVLAAQAQFRNLIAEIRHTLDG